MSAAFAMYFPKARASCRIKLVLRGVHRYDELW